MEVYKVIFEIILYLTEGLIVYYYAHSLFEERFKSYITIAGTLSGYTILYFVYQFDIAYLNAIAIVLIDTLLFMLLYKCSIKIAVFHSVLLLVFMVACEWIMIFIISSILKQDFNAYQNNYNIHILNTVTSKFIYYILCIVFARIFSKTNKQNKNKSVFWVLLILPLASLIMLLIVRYITFEAALSRTMNIVLSVASLFLLAANIIVFFIYEYSIKNSEKLFELQSIKQKQEIDKQYFAIIEKNNKDLKIFTHDIKNHLELIGNLTQDEVIKKYISDLYGTVNKYGNIASSGNKTLDVIISKYITVCSNGNIEITFNVKNANLSDIEVADLSNILNNLLDNAVEAAAASDVKKITIDIFSKESFEVIKIQNSCGAPPIISDKKLLTHKKESELHGFGIESVLRTLKKYNGIFDWSYYETEKIFEVTVVIPMQSS